MAVGWPIFSRMYGDYIYSLGDRQLELRLEAGLDEIMVTSRLSVLVLGFRALSVSSIQRQRWLETVAAGILFAKESGVRRSAGLTARVDGRPARGRAARSGRAAQTARPPPRSPGRGTRAALPFTHSAPRGHFTIKMRPSIGIPIRCVPYNAEQAEMERQCRHRLVVSRVDSPASWPRRLRRPRRPRARRGRPYGSGTWSRRP